MSTHDAPGKEVVAEWIYDDFGSGPGSIRVLDCGGPVMSVAIVPDKGEDREIVHAYRDQWGTWVSVGGFQIAQQDCTRSFLDGLIAALIVIRDCNCPLNICPAPTMRKDPAEWLKKPEPATAPPATPAPAP